jgi:hypothetical protein
LKSARNSRSSNFVGFQPPGLRALGGYRSTLSEPVTAPEISSEAL